MKQFLIISLFAAVGVFAFALSFSCQSNTNKQPTFPNALNTMIAYTATNTHTPCGYPSNTCTFTVTDTPTITNTPTPTHTCLAGQTPPC
jgi:hypothetical protein